MTKSSNTDRGIMCPYSIYHEFIDFYRPINWSTLLCKGQYRVGRIAADARPTHCGRRSICLSNYELLCVGRVPWNGSKHHQSSLQSHIVVEYHCFTVQCFTTVPPLNACGRRIGVIAAITRQIGRMRPTRCRRWTAVVDLLQSSNSYWPLDYRVLDQRGSWGREWERDDA